MSNIQMDLLYFINIGLQNPFFDSIVPIIYSLTDVRVMLALIILLIMASWLLKKEKLNKIAILMLIAFGLSSVFIFTSKIFYPSTRPFLAFESIRLTVHDNGFYSFPSGHFCIATTLLSVVLLKVEKYRRELFALSFLYLLILAFVVMYGGVHYPIDIIGGGILGIVSAVIVIRYLDGFAEYLVNLIII